MSIHPGDLYGAPQRADLQEKTRTLWQKRLQEAADEVQEEVGDLIGGIYVGTKSDEVKKRLLAGWKAYYLKPDEIRALELAVTTEAVIKVLVRIWNSRVRVLQDLDGGKKQKIVRPKGWRRKEEKKVMKKTRTQ
jgi:hypothetical protein